MRFLPLMRWKEIYNKHPNSNHNRNNRYTTLLLLLTFSSCVISQTFLDQELDQNEIKDFRNNPALDFFNIDLSVDVDDLPYDQYGNELWSLNGSVKFQTHYSTKDQLSDFAFHRDQAGLSQARTTLRLDFLANPFERVQIDLRGIGSYDIFYHQNREDFSLNEFNALADELAIREANIQFETFDNLWIKFGRQVVALGESDFTQLIDVVNPRDEREVGLVDLEDARLPITSTRLSYVGQRWGVDLVLTHEFEPNRYAGEGADFDRYITLHGVVDIDKDRQPDVGVSHSDKILRGFWSHSHGDINIVLAESFSQTPALALSPRGGNYVDEVYPELTTFGLSASWVEGFWLFKSELARKNDAFIPRSDLEQQLALGYGQGELFLEKDTVQALIGVEYSGYQNIQLSTEYYSTTILDYEDSLLLSKQESIVSSRVVFEFFRDTAELEILWAHWVNADSDSLRLVYNYDYSDEILLSLGHINFFSDDEEGELYPYKNSDRIFASFSYSF